MRKKINKKFAKRKLGTQISAPYTSEQKQIIKFAHNTFYNISFAFTEP